MVRIIGVPRLLARVWYKSVVCTRSAFHVSSQEMVRTFWISDLKIISITREKTDNKSSQDSNLGLLNSGQMLLPTQPPEFCHWSRGQMAYILRHSCIAAAIFGTPKVYTQLYSTGGNALTSTFHISILRAFKFTEASTLIYSNSSPFHLQQHIVTSPNPLQQADPEYEEVIELSENRAYKTVQNIEMKANEAYQFVGH